MPTPPVSGSPHDRPALEPIHVLRPRRTDALAELFREMEQSRADLESGAVQDPRSWDEGETQELPPVRTRDVDVPRAGGRLGFGPGLRRAAVTIAVTAAALVGFGCALLLVGRNDDAAAQEPRPTASAEPAATASAPGSAPGSTDPDGAGTLRAGDSGPAVTDLQERLLHIPDVYQNGSTNGTYDATLRAAVARFQLWYGIRGDEDGVYGDDTRQALESRTAPGTG
ncbi:peptidoglycan-binding protein [Streptomyces sp. NBC_00847]|uniref:peptidoglycan-binding domain-containing protein n=1 Tax=unclassified Streptomyces TaxID=2593676 RepID=UPI00225342F0|nr:peptidoglycan-binding domain-containing protein [Streptomyces sp. NBC_00847]MCX4878384.1 peptidoglycan-binding protein [Streptomyces sp. NBC_00847]